MSVYLKTDFAPFIQLTTFQDKTWLLVFQQDASVGYFNKPEDASFSLKTGMYSILSEISDSWKINHKYEFMLDYPSLGKKNIWRQTMNPIDDEESKRPNDKTALGYEAVYIQMTESGWGGLVRSSSGCSLLDGSVNTYNIDDFPEWYYAIGSCVVFWSGIPANVGSVQKVNLWIRFSSIKFIPHYEKKCFYSFLGISIFHVLN